MRIVFSHNSFWLWVLAHAVGLSFYRARNLRTPEPNIHVAETNEQTNKRSTEAKKKKKTTTSSRANTLASIWEMVYLSKMR